MSVSRAPNLYQVHGYHLQISYSTTGIDGKPHFAYQDSHRTMNFEGDQIRSMESEIGTLVSVTIFATVDAGSTSFTLLLPHVNLDRSHQATITTEGITTLHRSSLLPVFNQGQTELYTVERLTGTAAAVDF